jgi:hypothetical protein
MKGPWSTVWLHPLHPVLTLRLDVDFETLLVGRAGSSHTERAPFAESQQRRHAESARRKWLQGCRRGLHGRRVARATSHDGSSREGAHSGNLRHDNLRRAGALTFRRGAAFGHHQCLRESKIVMSPTDPRVLGCWLLTRVDWPHSGGLVGFTPNFDGFASKSRGIDFRSRQIGKTTPNWREQSA